MQPDDPHSSHFDTQQDDAATSIQQSPLPTPTTSMSVEESPEMMLLRIIRVAELLTLEQPPDMYSLYEQTAD